MSETAPSQFSSEEVDSTDPTRIHLMSDLLSEDEGFADYAAFQKQLPRLLSTHLNKFVAFSGGQLIDEDSDEFVLIERLGRTFKNRFVLIERITKEEPQQIWLD